MKKRKREFNSLAVFTALLFFIMPVFNVWAAVSPEVISSSLEDSGITIRFSSEMDASTINRDTVIIKIEIPGIELGRQNKKRNFPQHSH